MLFFSFIPEAFVKLKFLRYGTKEMKYFILLLTISESVRIEKLPYAKGLPSPVLLSSLVSKPVTWRK